MSGKNDIAGMVVIGGIGLLGYYFLRQSGSVVPRVGGGSIAPPIVNELRKIGEKKEDTGKGTTIIKLPEQSVTFPSLGTSDFSKLLEKLIIKKPGESSKVSKKETKKEQKSTKTIDYTQPSAASWAQFTQEVWGAKPGEWSASQGGIVATFSEIQKFGMPRSYLEWLKYPYSVPAAKKEVERKETIGIFGEPGEMLKAPKSLLKEPAKKETKKEFPSTPIKPYTYAKKSTSKSTTKKKKKIVDKPPDLPGGHWVRSGNGWTWVRD